MNPTKSIKTQGSPLALLHLAKQRANELFATKIGALKLTASQHIVLSAVRDNPGKTQTDLVHATGIDRSTLADIVTRLQSRRLVERRRLKHDARAYAVRLSIQGEEMMRRAAEAAREVDAQILSGLSEEQRHAFMRDLETIISDPDNSVGPKN